MADQRGSIKTFALSGRTATETHKMITEAYGELAFSRSRVFELFKQFKEGRVSINDDRGKCAKPTLRTDDNLTLISNLVIADRRTSIQELATESGLSYGTVRTILHEDLNLSKLSARWVPGLLSDEHKEKHLKMARDFTSRYFSQGMAFLDSLVTMDES
jgi:histone-lysine N-methyltransferase SETMAR